MAKTMVDRRYGNTDCKAYNDFRDIIVRDDIDAVLIGTPDHWHAIIAIEAMMHGKDVYCEKPETLTVREGRVMVETARRYGRVFSGGSQRVWGDYNWLDRATCLLCRRRPMLTGTCGSDPRPGGHSTRRLSGVASEPTVITPEAG
jgi:hypothetical protein